MFEKNYMKSYKKVLSVIFALLFVQMVVVNSAAMAMTSERACEVFHMTDPACNNGKIVGTLEVDSPNDDILVPTTSDESKAKEGTCKSSGQNCFASFIQNGFKLKY